MQKYVFVKNNGKYSQISFSEILYIEALKKYVRIITCERVYLLAASMCYLEKIIPENLFCRIHRSYIVSIKHIKDIDTDITLMDGKTLPIGKIYKRALLSKIFIIHEDRDASRYLGTAIEDLIQNIKPN